MENKRNYTRPELAARNRYKAKTYDALAIRGKKGCLEQIKKKEGRKPKRIHHDGNI